MNSKFIIFHVPEDKELLAEIGVVTLRHEHLNHILKMTVRSIEDMSIKEALDELKYKGTSYLRRRIEDSVKEKLGDSETLLKFQAILDRVKSVTEKRNKIIHGLWAKELDGDPGIIEYFEDFEDLSPLPTVDDLKNLGKEIEETTKKLNEARLDGGFLKEALKGGS